MRATYALLPAVLVFCAASSTFAQPPPLAEAPVTAVWTVQKKDFTYHGFTTRYSCEGLRGKLRAILARLGASELKVHDYGCDRPGGQPSVFPSASIEMKTLLPAALATPPAAVAATVPAHWTTVALTRAGDLDLDSGDCELVEQVRDELLPLFAARNPQMNLRCIPHQLTGGSLSLRVEVLVPDPPPG